MYCEGKSQVWSHNTSYCLIEVVTKAGLTVFPPSVDSYLADMIVHPVSTTTVSHLSLFSVLLPENKIE